MNSKIKWAGFVPLLGGMALGNAEAVGHKPEFFISYPAFTANDANIRKRWPDVPFLLLDPDTNWFIEEKDALFFEKNKDIDFCSAVPPCAGLSMMNAGGHADPAYKRGSDAVQNRWMLIATEFALKHLKPKVYFSENAPGLYSDLGKGVREKLIEIGAAHGYSFSIVKTNTKFHGIPQNRPRTFYFLWKSHNAPILNYYSRPRPTLAEHIGKVDRNGKYFNIDRATKLVTEDPYYRYVVDQYGKDYREVMKTKGHNSMFSFLEEEDKFEGCIKYFREKLTTATDPAEIKIWEKGVKNTEFMLNKLSMGKGYWNWSLHMFDEITNATVSRNMENTLHPNEERVLTLQEHMLQMGLPADFELADDRQWNHIAQNVPVTTARDWTYEVVKFVKGELEFSNKTVLMQDNTAQRIDTKGAAKVSDSSDFIINSF